MRKLSLAVVATLAVAVPSLAVAPAHAKPPKPQAELVAKNVRGTVSDGTIAVSATVKNKGSRKAGRSETTFRLSTDPKASADDPVIGSVATRRVKAKKTRQVSGRFTVPASVAPGSYRVIGCADSGLEVNERKEANNCKVSKGSVVVTGPITVSATAGAGGTVVASGITGGTCTGTTCRLQAGNSKVTFTPLANSGYRFDGWSGATCTGSTSGAEGAITFTNPTTGKACAATFVQQVTVAWSVSGGVPPVLQGAVSGAVTAGEGSCTAAGPEGTCTADTGATVTLTASDGGIPILAFQGWGPAPSASCTGTASGSSNEVYTLTGVTTDQSCVAAFSIII